MESNRSVAVVGEKDSIYCFAALGLEICEAENAEQALERIKELNERGCAVIYLVERFAEELEEKLEKYRDLPTPAIIPIPGAVGNTGYGMRSVRRSIEKAVGSDILGE